MIFSKLILENFRQFEGKIELEFSLDKSITLIIGSNGVGKTTLLQSLRYCFYGDSPNYLKLPNTSELLNLSVMNSMREREEAPLSVTAYFEHDGTFYYAERKRKFVKTNGKIKMCNEESFGLWRSSTKKGYSPLDQEQSELLIRQIMPPGLVHIYMFDGERMEKRVETSDYKNDLKEAIRGILGLKKLEYALELLGTENMKLRVMGMVNALYKAHSAEERKALETLTQLGSKKEVYENEIAAHNEKINELKQKIEIVQKHQDSMKHHREQIASRKNLESELAMKEQELEGLAKEGLAIGVKLLLIKELAVTYPKYDSFMKKSTKSNEHFQSLHVDTLNDIIKKGVCICGEEIKEGTDKYLKILSLEEHVLPHDNAHYLNKISDEYSRILDYPALKDRLDEIKGKTVSLKSAIRKIQIQIEDTIQMISDLETAMGGARPQEELNTLNELMSNERTEIAIKELAISTLESKIRESRSIIKDITKNDEHNFKVKSALDALQKVKDALVSELKKEESSARIILQKNLNTTINKVMEGEFLVNISEDFELNIRQIFKNCGHEGGKFDIQQTDILSTGQSVMVSLSFIDSLLATLDEIRESKFSHHGIVMDAALSNVDEKHISNVCNRVMNHFDQLIFLSIKRHLRDEFYAGIKDCIGKCYKMHKNESGNTVFLEIEIDELNTFIHSTEEEEENDVI